MKITTIKTRKKNQNFQIERKETHAINNNKINYKWSENGLKWRWKNKKRIMQTEQLIFITSQNN